jgi:hypothetical protein
MAHEHCPLHTFRVSLTDRKNRRTVQATSGKEAVGLVVGKRFFSANQRNWAEDGSSAEYDVTIQVGRTVGGATPVNRISAYVETI